MVTHLLEPLAVGLLTALLIKGASEVADHIKKETPKPIQAKRPKPLPGIITYYEGLQK